jgi:hypothetical protein
VYVCVHMCVCVCVHLDNIEVCAKLGIRGHLPGSRQQTMCKRQKTQDK